MIILALVAMLPCLDGSCQRGSGLTSLGKVVEVAYRIKACAFKQAGKVF